MASIDSTNFQFWDISGQHRFVTLNFPFVKNADIAVYCVDLSQSLNQRKMDLAFEYFNKYTADMPKIPIILVGTKTDLERQVSDEEFEELLSNEKYGFTKGIKVSTKESKNISELSTMLKELAPVKQQSIPLSKYSLFENSQQAKSNSKEEASCEIPLLFYILCVPGWPVFLLYHLVNFLADTCATSSDVGEESVERKLQF